MEDKEKTKPESSPVSDISDKIWDFFTSVKLTIVILIIIALTSIIGTIIEQDAEPEKNIQLLAKFFGDSMAPTFYNIFLKLDFMNMYHSWWFIALLLLFCVNLIVCTLDRLPKTLKIINAPMKPMGETVIKTLPVKKELRVNAGLAAAKDAFLNSLSAAGFRVFEATEGDSVELYTQKGRYSRLGLYIVHLSIFLIFIGAIIGARFGFNAMLNIPEGGTSDIAYQRGGKQIPLGFTVKCNWYRTDYYGDTDMPQEFQSELVIIDSGREILTKVIEVNSPLTYKGITFYQSSYGLMSDVEGVFILKVTPRGGQETTINAKLGDTFVIPGTNVKVEIVNFSPALAKDPMTGKLFTYNEKMMVNPAVGVRVSEPGKPEYTGWIMRRYPETGVLPDGNKITLDDYWGVEYTGLQVSRDPGVGIIYFAAIIMSLGLFMAFFMSNRKLWIRLTGEKGAVRVALGGTASKNRLSFEKDVEKILSNATHSIEGSPQIPAHRGRSKK
ncbi:MAG: cytochrome c biogenesis protein ResB [Nitrospirae bacterium]|nr:cytochrome c biogenesis protein ResB [Nitrospirota bacterium]